MIGYTYTTVATKARCDPGAQPTPGQWCNPAWVCEGWIAQAGLVKYSGNPSVCMNAVLSNINCLTTKFNSFLGITTFQMHDSEIVQRSANSVVILPISFQLPPQNLFEYLYGFHVLTVRQVFGSHFVDCSQIVLCLIKRPGIEVNWDRFIALRSS